ncbi:hypothetical protein B0H66DRAFT_608997 [Apodospora peruviana]|uniref:Uncharacterized protein n=1 Tax=Apodospora peruviana TaxID=516989 RepID=A0AAE0HS87_9PEZI|nr:hypothetical protein B0H66DRAFT_608997 [Apodospora peruviana]
MEMESLETINSVTLAPWEKRVETNADEAADRQMDEDGAVHQEIQTRELAAMEQALGLLPKLRFRNIVLQSRNKAAMLTGGSPSNRSPEFGPPLSTTHDRN